MKLCIDLEILNLDDEMIAVPSGDMANSFTGVLKVNEEAASILKLLAKDTTKEEIAVELLKEYDVPKEQLLNEVHSFIEQLRNNHLISE